MKKLNLKLLVVAFVLFLPPWTHKLVYENILAAFPNTHQDGAHFAALILGIIAGFLAATI